MGGVDDLLECLKGLSKEEQDKQIVELLMEDVVSLLDNAVWNVER